MQYCPHCMRPVTGARCASCGGDVSWTGQKGIDLPVGTVLNGGNGLRTYQVGAARGKGGFGITYVALETNSGKRMALKEYFPTRCAFRGGNGVDVQAMTGQEEPFQSGMDHFLAEGKMLLSQDDLSCVVHVIDYFQANGTAYLVMEYLDGVALHAQMTRMGGRIPVNELMPRLAPLMRDIGQLHKRGVIHRDISPDNIMWMPEGGLKLLDFGSARSMESGKSMTVLMKQGFSPIEQYRSRGQGTYTDIYALAATIYYCVTGVIPPSSMERLGEDTLQSPIALGAALTVQQETALLWALSIQPNGRPQSMEEFSAMLYQDGPAATSAPVPSGAPYSAQPSFHPQPEQPPQAQPRSSGQPAGPSQYAGQPVGQPAAPGQYVGQPVGQPAGPGQYAGQPAGPGQYAGQPAGPGQYAGQPSGPGPYAGQPAGPGQNWTGGGGNKKLPVFIGIGAAVAAVVALVIGMTVWMGGDREDTVEHSSWPSQSAAPVSSFVPISSFSPATSHTPETSHVPEISQAPTSSQVPEPSMAPVSSGAPTQDPAIDTVDGFLYEIVDQDHVVLTGCVANAKFNYMPDEVNGIPVTGIADGAFAGASTGGAVNLPFYLKTIGADAFRGCTDLSYIYAYSEVTVASSSFSGCSNMWFVAVRSSTADFSGWVLPSDVGLYRFGMETGYGALGDMTRSGSLLLGETQSGYTVLLDVRPGTATVTGLESVDWICPWALDNLGYGASIELGENTLYPYEAFNMSLGWSAPDGALSDMWMLSCKTAWDINATRPGGTTRIVPDLELMKAAMIRAEEYAQLRDISTRPNGSSWSTVLDELKIDYGWAAVVAGSRANYAEAWNRAAEYIAQEYTAALTQSDSSVYAGQYYSRVGVAVAQEYDGQYTWAGYLIIP